jgi:hypothetical protein
MAKTAPLPADNPFLAEVLEAIRRRSKSLKHRNATPDVRRIVEIRDGETFERVEIVIESRRYQRLVVIARDDRWTWVSATESIKNAGWKFVFESEGRLGGNGTGRELVEALEASLAVMFDLTEEDTGRLEAIWSLLLARGPRPI